MLHHHFHPATKGGLLYILDVSCVRYALQTALKKNVKREKLEKISNIEYFKGTALRWKNCSYEYKRVNAFVESEKGEKMAYKAYKGTFFTEIFLFQKRKKLQL